MAPKSLAEQIAELEDPTPKDYDPEDLDRAGQGSDDEGPGADESAGREHYQAVGKGKFRKQDPVRLGKQYAGSRISRDALEEESDDDPFKARSSDEEEEGSEDEEGSQIGSDEEVESEDDEESEEEKPKSKRAAKEKTKQKKAQPESEAESMSDASDDVEGEEESDEEMDDEMGSDDDEEDEDEDENEDEEDDDDENEEEEDDAKPKGPKSDDREELRRLMATDQKTIASTISQAAKADAEKGKAVKQQRSTFDSLLNTRIKLQKGLTAINQLSSAAKDTEDMDGEAIKSAETAALALWSTLEDLRIALADVQTPDESKKRKRPSPVDSTTSPASLWKRMTDLESESVAHRRTILDKWSSKVRGSNATLPNARGKLLGASTGGQQAITAVLDAQVASETGERAVKRSRKNESNEDEPIYDDTIFYQSLLRELVEQRMSSEVTNGLDTLNLQLPSRLSIHPVTGMRNDKVKRDVDTRASKGRKMKYDVHEKLQNFMAPEDRGSWTNRAREEFFASLLGKTASGMLGEGDEEASDAESEGDVEGGLRLFRS